MRSLMKYTLAISLFFTIFCFCSVSAETSGAYTYTVANGEASITGYSDYKSSDIIIPATLGGYPVTAIGDSAFKNKSNLISVVVPEQVKSLARYSFYENEQLESITLPDGLTTIGGSSFGHCHHLKNINLPAGLICINGGTFSYCTNLKNIVLPDSIQSIGTTAFFGSGITDIAVPNNVTSIGNQAFSFCLSLENITLGEKVQTIGNAPFYGSEILSTITVSANNPYFSSLDGVLFNKDKTELVCFTAGNPITSYTVPESVMRIGKEAFYNCKNLQNVKLGNNILDISEYAFYECRNLTSVILGENITTIANGAFQYCAALSDITFGLKYNP